MEKLNSEDGQLFIKVSNVARSTWRGPVLIRSFTEPGQFRAHTRESTCKQLAAAAATCQECVCNKSILSSNPDNALKYL